MHRKSYKNWAENSSKVTLLISQGVGTVYLKGSLNIEQYVIVETEYMYMYLF